MRAVTELAAGPAERVEGARRPGFFTVFFLTIFGCAAGMFASLAAVWLVSFAGVATTGAWAGTVPFLPTGFAPVLADVVAVLYFTSLAVVLTRGALGAWTDPDDPPALTWIALTLVPAAALAVIAPSVSLTGGWAIAAVAVRYVAWDREGRARPEPLLSRRAARHVAVLAPALLLAALSGYALVHPLRTGDTGEAARIQPGTSPVLVPGPNIYNYSSRPVRVLSIEPGRERGYALHLIGVRTFADGVAVDGHPPTRDVTSFTIGANDAGPPLRLQLSRAGCRPGTSGRIETVRVRYVRGGQHVMELPVKPALTLNC